MFDLDTCIIHPTDSIRVAMEAVNRSTIQVALVADRDRILLGTVTDGDIRRALLLGHKMVDPITIAMNDSPITASLGESRRQVELMMRQKTIRHVPIVDPRGRVVDIMFLGKHPMVRQRDYPVIVMAGGLGTRLEPLTQIKPKPMLTVGGKPILETILESLVAQGFWQFYFSVYYKQDQIRSYFGDGSSWNVDIHYLQEVEPFGTAGALGLLPDQQRPVLLINGDILCQLDTDALFDHHISGGYALTVAVCRYETTIPFGCVSEQDGMLVALDEKPTNEYLINGGIYVISPEAIQKVPKGQAFQVTDLVQRLLEADMPVGAFVIDSYWRDVGNHIAFERANRDYHDNFGGG